jgi:hypothetical protein
MSKGGELPQDLGFVSGHSKILDECKELVFIEDDIPKNELEKIMSSHKVIRSEYVSIVCCDIMKLEKLAPLIFSVFEQQYMDFSERITLSQKFHEC